MAYCSKCGKEIGNNVGSCPYCGAAMGNGSANSYSYQSNYGAQSPYSAPNPYAGPQGPYQQPVSYVKDETNIGLCILAWFIPLFGFIYWGIKSNETPKKAKACGITALISTVINVVVSVIIYLVAVAGLFATTYYYY